MRLTIIKDDNIVGIDGVFKSVALDGLISEGIRAVQWEGSVGEIEFYNPGSPNLVIHSLDQFSGVIAIYNLPPQDSQEEEQPPEVLIAAAHARINAAYDATIAAITVGYPASEQASWPKQENEARAWAADEFTPTPWIDAAATERGMPKSVLAQKILENANLFVAFSGTQTGKRQRLRDEIDALGNNPTEAQLEEIQW